MGLVQLLLAGIVMVINQKFFINGFKGLIHGAPNMDTLVALGSMASFVWSTYALFAMTRAQVDGNGRARHALYDGVLLRVCRHDPDSHHGGQDAGSPLQGQDHRRPQEPDEAGPQDRHAGAGRSGSDRGHRRRCRRATSLWSAPARISRWTAWCWKAPAQSTRAL